MKRIRIILFILLLLMIYGLVRLHILNQKPLILKEFSTYELVEIYSLGIVMSIIAYPFLPEVAEEHARLMFFHDKSTSIVGNGAYFLKSKVVQSAIKKSCDGLTPVRLEWNTSSYELKLDYRTYVESRTALAINGFYVKCENGDPYIWGDVTYPKKGMVTFLSIKGYNILRVEEGLFRLLEDYGWYQNYYYKWLLTEKKR